MRAADLLKKSGELTDDAGSSSLEFAVVTAVFLSVIMGILQISLVLYAHHFISEAARLGSRYAMVRGSSCTVSGTSCTVTSSQVQSYVQNLVYPGINSAKLSVNTTYSAYPAGSGCTPSASCTNPGNLVTVTVSYPAPLNLPFISVSSLQMSSTSAMIIAQ
jgi:Flp pilus assembly protein TadG